MEMVRLSRPCDVDGFIRFKASSTSDWLNGVRRLHCGSRTRSGLWLSVVSTFVETDYRGRACEFAYVLEVSWEESYDGKLLEGETGKVRVQRRELGVILATLLA